MKAWLGNDRELISTENRLGRGIGFGGVNGQGFIGWLGWVID
jgi:hypothetical protein